MNFEYDPEKSRANLFKHAIDFEQAKALWDSVVVDFPTYNGTDEERTLTVGIIDGKHWTAITTQRGSALRIISVRRSRKKKVEAYDKAVKCKADRRGV